MNYKEKNLNIIQIMLNIFSTSEAYYPTYHHFPIMYYDQRNTPPPPPPPFFRTMGSPLASSSFPARWNARDFDDS